MFISRKRLLSIFKRIEELENRVFKIESHQVAVTFNKGAVSLEDVAREVFDNRRNH